MTYDKPGNWSNIDIIPMIVGATGLIRTNLKSFLKDIPGSPSVERGPNVCHNQNSVHHKKGIEPLSVCGVNSFHPLFFSSYTVIYFLNCDLGDTYLPLSSSYGL